MNRVFLALFCVCLLGAAGAAYRKYLPVEEHNKAEQNTEEHPATLPVVQVPVPVEVAVEEPITALIGQPKSVLVKRLGAPRSQIDANGIQILRYETDIFKLKDGVVLSVDPAPKELRSTPKPQVVATPAPQVHRTVQQTQVQINTQININPDRFRYTVEDRVVRWARTMTRNTNEWYRPRSIQMSNFDPVSGWSNRYHANGSCEVWNYPHGWRLQNFEVYMDLNENGEFKDADISPRS